MADDPSVAACRHCGKPIVRCENQPSHIGCSSGYGWIHADPNWGHTCVRRAASPSYARPEVNRG